MTTTAATTTAPGITARPCLDLLSPPPYVHDGDNGYRVWTAAHGLTLDQLTAPLLMPLHGWTVNYSLAAEGVIAQISRPCTPRPGQTEPAEQEHHRLHGTSWREADEANSALFAAGVLGVKVPLADIVQLTAWHRFGHGYGVPHRQQVLTYALPRALRRETALDAVLALTEPLDDDVTEAFGRVSTSVLHYYEKGYRTWREGDLVAYGTGGEHEEHALYEHTRDGWRALPAGEPAQDGPAVEPLFGAQTPDRAADHLVDAVARVGLFWDPWAGRWEVSSDSVDGYGLSTEWVDEEDLPHGHPDCPNTACDGAGHVDAQRAVSEEIGIPSGAEIIAAFGAAVLRTDAVLDGNNGLLKALYSLALRSQGEQWADLVLAGVFGCRFSQPKPADHPGNR